jgi:hypothetical protein
VHIGHSAAAKELANTVATSEQTANVSQCSTPRSRTQSRLFYRNQTAPRYGVTFTVVGGE